MPSEVLHLQSGGDWSSYSVCFDLNELANWQSRMQPHWPKRLWIIRYAQSAGVARNRPICIDSINRDVDVFLSELRTAVPRSAPVSSLGVTPGMGRFKIPICGSA
jgi:hypothetical protein